MSGQEQQPPEKPAADKASHMPSNSFFFEKLVPGLLFLMAIVTVALILFALAVLLGVISF